MSTIRSLAGVCAGFILTCQIGSAMAQQVSILTPVTLQEFAKTPHATNPNTLYATSPAMPPLQGSDGFLYGITRASNALHSLYRLDPDSGDIQRSEHFSSGGLISGYYSSYVEYQGFMYTLNYSNAVLKFAADDVATSSQEILTFTPGTIAGSTPGKVLALDAQRGMVYAGGGTGQLKQFNLINGTQSDLLLTGIQSPLQPNDPNAIVGVSYVPAVVWSEADSTLYGVAQNITGVVPDFIPAGHTATGAIFKVNLAELRPADERRVPELLHVFTYERDGGGPARFATNLRHGGDLIEDGDYLYGTTQGRWNRGSGIAPADFEEIGTIWRIRKDDPSSFTTIYRFLADNGEKGNSPIGRLVRGADGNIYGTTQYHGNEPVLAQQNGTGGAIYRIAVDRANADRRGDAVELVHVFPPNPDDRSQVPNGLSASSDGWSLYGVTHVGGANSAGSIYKLDIPRAVAIQGFNASRSTIVQGETVTLSWSVEYAVSCTASGASDWRDEVAATGGSVEVTPLSGENTYTLECAGSSGDVRTAVVSVTANPPEPAQILSFAASPTLLLIGTEVVLSWDTQDVGACSASGSDLFTGEQPTSADRLSLGAFNTAGQYTFTLNCSSRDLGGDSAERSVSVTVQTPPAPASAVPLPPYDGKSKGGGGSTSTGLLALLALAAVARWRLHGHGLQRAVSNGSSQST